MIPEWPDKHLGAEDQMFAQDGVATVRQRQSSAKEPPRGGVYFVLAAGAGLVKIGWVRNFEKVERRLDRIATDCPYPIQLLHLIESVERVVEPRIQRHFDACHHHGEWYRCEAHLKEFLQLAAVEPESASAILISTVAKELS